MTRYIVRIHYSQQYRRMGWGVKDLESMVYGLDGVEHPAVVFWFESENAAIAKCNELNAEQVQP